MAKPSVRQREILALMRIHGAVIVNHPEHPGRYLLRGVPANIDEDRRCVIRWTLKRMQRAGWIWLDTRNRCYRLGDMTAVTAQAGAHAAPRVGEVEG